MNLEAGTVCSLPNYPGGKGPTFLQNLDKWPTIAACGSFLNPDDNSCFQLDGLPAAAAWTAMPSMLNSHCASPYQSSSHYLSPYGWFIFGQDDSCSFQFSNISTEILTEDLEWMTTPTVSPYSPSAFPSGACSVQLNSTHILVTGGFNGLVLDSAWLLDLTTYTWMQLAPMLEPRHAHGCLLTSRGEVLVVGGQTGPSGHVYNVARNEWREEESLPDEIYYWFPRQGIQI